MYTLINDYSSDNAMWFIVLLLLIFICIDISLVYIIVL
jgi:hypothetical protein